MTLVHPFTLPGMAHPHPGGTFAVTEERESLDVTWTAFHVATTLMLPTAGGYEAWPISAADLDRLLADDKAR